MSSFQQSGGGGGGGGGKMMPKPNLDERSTKMLNLTVLQRIDPFIEEILITAAHVTLYEFNIDLNQWSRKDVEGSLFVVKRNTQPRFQFIVMNRRNTENLVENLLEDFEYEVQVPYLLYRNAVQEVNGIWFYNARECEEVANLFSRILGAYTKVPLKPANKSEFEELEAVPTSAVIEGPLEPAFNASASTDIPEDSSFINIFNTAMTIGHGSINGKSSGQSYNPVPAPPSSSLVPSAALSPVPTGQVQPLPLSASPIPSVSLYDVSEPIHNTNRVANLVKPSSFFATPVSPALLAPPITSSLPAPSHYAPLSIQRPHGTPLLQPFPPPTPPPSLTPNVTPPSYGPVDRERVRDALIMLVQDNQFIDMFYQALLKTHQS